MNFLGIDIGTSAVKALVVDAESRVLAEASAPLTTRHPRSGWSEQDAEDWWRAVGGAVASLRERDRVALDGVAAIGLSGQMHAALILDEADRPIRPAILWNDGRAVAECEALTAAVPGLAEIAGVIAMPGFTAPKLMWLGRHESDAFRQARRVSLPKDYVRLRMTGEFATDMADAAGALLLDEAERRWSDAILATVRVMPSMLPRLLEGPAVSGTLRQDVAAAWGLRARIPIAAGAADAAAGAIGIGAIEDGDRFISIGTSAQFFVTRNRYEPKPEQLIHAFAHALPGRWFEMAAMLNGATCLDWAARLIGAADIDGLLARVEARFAGPSPVLFLPYLSGERTPHNDAAARGVFAGLDAATAAENIIQAVLDGVALSLVDARDALGEAGRRDGAVAVIGGAARSRFWLRIIASALGLTVLRLAGADKGPVFGAAHLARMALTGEAAAAVCRKPEVVEEIRPEPKLVEAYDARLGEFRRLYRSLKAAR